MGCKLLMVATVLTVYGIETPITAGAASNISKLQQCLPFTVLKPFKVLQVIESTPVATVLTVYGIETIRIPAIF
mgnify:CR=1 FL=1